MAKEANAIDLAPEAYFDSLLTKIEKLVGLKEALIEMFNHNIDWHAQTVCQDEASKIKEEIEAMLGEIKERLIFLKNQKPCTHGDDPYNPVV